MLDFLTYLVKTQALVQAPNKHPGLQKDQAQSIKPEGDPSPNIIQARPTPICEVQKSYLAALLHGNGISPFLRVKGVLCSKGIHSRCYIPAWPWEGGVANKRIFAQWIIVYFGQKITFHIFELLYYVDKFKRKFWKNR
jgi:hypothetical protein